MQPFPLFGGIAYRMPQNNQLKYLSGGCASSVQIIQFGESPNPVKPSKQPVHSLGAEAARSGLSVGSGVQEPQCESVKRYSPVSYIERKPIPSFRSQAVIRQSICENAVGSVGVRERGECTK